MTGLRPGTRGRPPGAVYGEVLCVEDDPVVQVLLGDVVRTAGGNYHAASCAREAEDLLGGGGDFDLILLDRRLPDGDGLLLLQAIKQHSDCPVVVLSAMDEIRDKILGLGLGATEYVTKPFHPAELSSRVRALLLERGRSRQAARAEVLTCGALRFRADTRCLCAGGAEIYLPPAEARLLQHFLHHPGEAHSRDDLTRIACGRDWTPGDRTIDVLIARLRRRIPAEAARIVTIHRFGYAFAPAG